MSLERMLSEIKEKTEAMIHWQTIAKQDVNDGPYPTMLRLLAVIEKLLERSNDSIEATWNEMYKDGNWNKEAIAKSKARRDAELLAILEGK